MPARIVRRERDTRELPLFVEFAPSPEGVAFADGDALLYRGWLAAPDAAVLRRAVLRDATWSVERRTMYDRVVDVPREQAWFGDAAPWRRAGTAAELVPGDHRAASSPVTAWSPELVATRDAVASLCGVRFAYVLANRYRDGRDSVAWHNDRTEPGLPEPVIASLSLGATRGFDIRPKAAPTEVVSIELGDGDLIVMRGAMQRAFDHRVRKDPRVSGERINLTFRQRAE